MHTPAWTKIFRDKDCKYKYCELALRILQSNAGNDITCICYLQTKHICIYEKEEEAVMSQ